MEYKNNRTANRRRYKSRYHSPHNYKTQRSKSENRAAILIAVATFLVIASLVLVFTFGDKIYAFMDGIFHPAVATADEPTALPDGSEPTSADGTAPTTEAPTAAPTAAPTQPPTEPPTQAPTKPPVKQEAEFERLIAAAGLSSDSLSGSQMIFVESSGTNAVVYTYEKQSDGVWKQKLSPISGFTGAGGVSTYSVPRDNITPSGTYGIEYAIGLNPDPGTALSYTQIVEGMRWITDPDSINYNRMIDGNATYIDFEYYQDLTEYTLSYPYALVFSYNRDPVDSTQGCQKLLHVSSYPTKYGGIGISEADMRSILLWLKPEASPTISIF